MEIYIYITYTQEFKYKWNRFSFETLQYQKHARKRVIVLHTLDRSSSFLIKSIKQVKLHKRLTVLANYFYSALFFRSPSLFSHSGDILVRRESSTESGVHRCQAKVFIAVGVFLFSIALTYALINENKTSVSSGDQFCVISRLFKHTVVEFEHIFVWFWLYNWRRSF